MAPKVAATTAAASTAATSTAASSSSSSSSSSVTTEKVFSTTPGTSTAAPAPHAFGRRDIGATATSTPWIHKDRGQGVRNGGVFFAGKLHEGGIGEEEARTLLGGQPFDMMQWVESSEINKAAVLRRAGSLSARRSVKSAQQLAFYIRAIQCIDLTTLDGADTPTNVRRLCAKAAKPLSDDTRQKLGLTADAEKGLQDIPIHCGAICVYPSRVADAVKALKALPGGKHVEVASVATGFPAGQTPLRLRLEEIKCAVEDGATEIDIVLNRTLVINQDWRALFDEVFQMRQACGKAHLKAILAVGDLSTYREVYRASIVCMCAGSDFIKTSTGKETVNATLPVGFVMARAIRDYHERTGFRVGFKPAGGIRSAKDTLSWLAMMAEECGEPWTHPDLFRIGASTLLGDLERQIDHGLTGTYSADRYIPMS